MASDVTFLARIYLKARVITGPALIISNDLMFYSTQGNQVAIKKIKNHVSCNFQKPSIVAEFNVVKFTFLNFCFFFIVFR